MPDEEFDELILRLRKPKGWPKETAMRRYLMSNGEDEQIEILDITAQTERRVAEESNFRITVEARIEQLEDQIHELERKAGICQLT